MTRRSKIKVLQIQVRYSVNASDLAEQIIVGLPAEQYEVTTLFLRGRPGPGAPTSVAGRSVYFDLASTELKGFRRWAALRRLYRFCRQEGFDAVIAHRFKPMSMMLWIGRLLNNTAIIGIQHSIGDYDRRVRRIEAGILITPQWRIVGVSSAVTSYLVDTVGGFNSGNTLTINNAINIDQARRSMLEPEHARAQLGIPRSRRVVGCIGRLVPVKGHALLLLAFTQIVDRYPDVLIAIIGDGRSRSELESIIAEHGLQQNILLLGAHNDALRYVRAFDVFAMPSYSEGLPLALLEALAGERPVIGSDILSMLPILQGCGGSVFRAGDAGDLALKLSALLDTDMESLRDRGRVGYEYLRQSHAVDDFRGSYLELLAAMLDER